MKPAATSPDVDALLQETLAAQSAAEALRDGQTTDSSAPPANTFRVVSVDEDASTGPIRSSFQQRLVDAERGFALAFRSESTLVGYAVFAAIAAVAAGVLRVPGPALILMAFVAVQATLVEMGRIAIRGLVDRKHKSARVATAASVFAALFAVATVVTVIGIRFAESL